MKVGDIVTVSFHDGEKRECHVKEIIRSNGNTQIYVDEFNIYKPHKFNEEETLKFLEGELDV